VLDSDLVTEEPRRLGASVGDQRLVRCQFQHKADADFLTIALLLEELTNLLATLGIADKYHLLGHSWGSFLAAEHAATHPAGLSSLVLADSGAPNEVIAGRAQARTRLPEDVQLTLRQHEAAGTTDSPE